MSNRYEPSMLSLLTGILFVLFWLITRTNGTTCANLSMDPTSPPCSIKTFGECDAGIRSNIHVTNATVTVGSGVAVDATDAANSIIQCRESTCINLAFFLLTQYSLQFCFTLDYTLGPSLHFISATITISYTGGNQTTTTISFNGIYDNSVFQGGSFSRCSLFRLSSTTGPTTTPSAGSSLNIYQHELCKGQPATTQPATTQPATTQPGSTQSDRAQPAVTQGDATHSVDPLTDATRQPKARIFTPAKDSKGRTLIGYCLTDHVMKTVSGVSQIECAMMCNDVAACKSFNYKDGVCELNEERKESVGSSYFSRSSGCTYYEPK